MNPSNPWFRFWVGIVAVAIALRIAYELVRPVLPLVLVVVLGVVLMRAYSLVPGALVTVVAGCPVGVVKSSVFY